MNCIKYFLECFGILRVQNTPLSYIEISAKVHLTLTKSNMVLSRYIFKHYMCGTKDVGGSLLCISQ